MANENTGEIKIIEQQSLVPDSYYQPNELMVDHLFSEVQQISHDLDKVEQVKIDFVFGLLQKAFENNKPEDLYKKSRDIRPTNPRYKREWHLQNFEELSEEEYQKILNNPKARENFTVRVSGRDFTETFSPEFVEAVKRQDVETFKKLIKDRKYKIDITDKKDSRYGSKVLADDQ